MKGKAHPEDLRAKVVAECISGCQQADVAERYGVPFQTVSQWVKQATTEWVQRPGATAQRYEQAAVNLIDLVSNLVAESIVGLTAQARFTAQDSWLDKQGARGLAEYRGVEFDRLIRLLSAFRPTEPEPSTAIGATIVDAPAGPADIGDGVTGG